MDKIINHKEKYPIDFLRNFGEFESELTSYLVSLKQTTSIFCRNIDKCVICDHELKNKNKRFEVYEAQLYYCNKPSEKCSLFVIICKTCNCYYFLNYYVYSGKKHFFQDFVNAKYLSFSQNTIFEKNIFEILTSDIVFKQSSFKAFCLSYNFLWVKSGNIKREELNEKRLAECWFYYHLLLYQIEFVNPDISLFDAPNSYNIDDCLIDIRNNLFKNFVKKWTGFKHENICTDKKCSQALVLDGNWKCNRLKCAFNGIYVNSDIFGEIRVGCIKTPERGSYYCLEHKSKEKTLIFKCRDKAYSFILTDIKCIKPVIDILCIHDSFKNLNDKSIYFVELIDNSLVFVDKIYLNEKLLKEYCFTDSTCNVELICSVDKGILNCYKNRTRGVCLASYNCGFIVGFRELHFSESLSQISLMCLDIITHSDQFCRFPEYIIYDNACHLRPYIENKKIKENHKDNKCALSLLSKKFFIDRMHLNNHKGKYCFEHCDMDTDPNLDNVNSQVVEQLNFWFSKFKHNLKHMNYVRYLFFIFIILNVYNNYRIYLYNKKKKK